MECVLALAIVAMTLPGVMLVFSEAGTTAQSSLMEGEARRAILRHADQVMMEGFSSGEGRLIWAHHRVGHCLGRVDEAAYQNGLARLRNEAVHYLIVAEPYPDADQELMLLALRMEYPARAPAGNRKCVKMFTRVMP